MTRRGVGLLGLAAAGSTVTALLTRMFVQALREIDVDIVLDPYGQGARSGTSPADRPAVTGR